MKDVLSEVETAEELFERLGVAFEAQVLAPRRLHVLRQFGLKVAQLGELGDTAEAKRLYAEILRQAYDDCAADRVRASQLFPGLGQELVPLGRKKGC